MRAPGQKLFLGTAGLGRKRSFGKPSVPAKDQEARIGPFHLFATQV